MFYEKAEEHRYKCYKCGEELVFEVKIQRLDTCPNCGAWLHCCYNCKYWNPNVHNECELQVTEFVRDRSAPNFCTYFEFRPIEEEDENEEAEAKKKLEQLFGSEPGEGSAPKDPDEARKKLEELFKK